MARDSVSPRCTASSNRAVATSRFTVNWAWVPCSRFICRATGEEPEPTSKSSPRLPRFQSGTETVLLVEDEAGVRTLTRLILQGIGYKILETQNGGEALLLCERHQGKIDLMLTDVVMPQMSGCQLAERLAPLRPEMKVLFMSGYTDEAVAQHGVLQPDMPFLRKPFTPDALARRVREVLDEEDVPAHAHEAPVLSAS